MSMLIRSQDKKSILNLDKVMQLCVVTPPFGTVERMIMANGAGVGTYSTEEKAIKVLDMIEDAYKDFRGGNIYEHSVFQMPQDEEVEV